MTVNLRNTSGSPLLVKGKTVDDDEVLAVDGTVSKDSPDDAYLIGDALWPTANWTTTGKEKD